MSARSSRIVVFLALVAAPAVYAQSGSIRVRVMDPGSVALPGATVVLTNEQQLVAPSTVITNADGIASFPVLRAGPAYVLEVKFPGYETATRSQLRVSTDKTTELTVGLQVGIHEEVSVEGGRDIVDVDTTGAVTHFSDQFLDELPVQSRFYQNVLTLAPGALDPDQDGNPNVHGARARDVRVLLGGVANVDPLTGQWMSYVNADSIEELDVITSGAGAEWGRAQGGWGRILQKQGTNEFEGVVGILYRSSELDGIGSTAPDQDLPEYDAVQPWVQFSGPIIKDRLWFRLSHERIRRDDPVTSVNGRLAVTTLEQNINSDQITWQASPRNKLAFHYDSDPRTIYNAEVTSAVPPESAQIWEFGGPMYRLSWTAAQSANLLVDSEVGFQDNDVNVLPTTNGTGNTCLRNDFYPSLNGAQCFFTNDNEYSGSYFRSSRDTRQRLTFRSDLDWFAGRFAGMTHHVQFGVIVENERYARTLGLRPDVVFTWYWNPFGPNTGYGTYRLPVPSTSSAEVDGDVWGLYIEDQMKPAENLTITAGFRYDHEKISGVGWSSFDPMAEYQAYRSLIGTMPLTQAMSQSFTAYDDLSFFVSGLADALAVTPNVAMGLLSPATRQSVGWPNKREPVLQEFVNKNPAPRFSIAWDPKSDGKRKLMLSAGRYYDKIFLGVPLIEQEPSAAYLTALAYRTLRGQWITFDIPSYDMTISQRTVDPNLRTPYQDEAALSYEQSLSPETSFKVTLLRRAFKDQLQDEDINIRPGDFGRCVRSGRTWRLDTSRGPDGTLDDCLFGTPDGIPDLYLLNPAWGQVLRVGNLNSMRYTAAVFQLTRRMYRSWQLESSYTFSRAEGDGEDFDQVLGNDRTLLDAEQGVLAYDQTHVLKVSGAGFLPHGIHLGGVVRWESGLPYSIYSSYGTVWSTPPDSLSASARMVSLRYPTGQRNDQRNEPYWTLDLRLAKEWAIRKAGIVQLSAEVFNVLDNDVLTVIDETDGGEEWVMRQGRRWQLGARFTF